MIIINFNSNAKKPYHIFSNFYECKIVIDINKIPDFIHEVCIFLKNIKNDKKITFNSTEHLWQSLKSNDIKTFLSFTTEGILGKLNINTFKLFYKKNEEAEKKYKWWSKKKMIGIISKMALSEKNTEKIGLSINRKNNKLKENEKKIWLWILKQKYEQNLDLKKILIKSYDFYLLEFDKNAKRLDKNGKSSYWGGYYDNDIKKIIGCNKMGEYLMIIREEIIKNEKIQISNKNIINEENNKKDYKKITVKELRKICKEKKIKGYSKLRKKELYNLCF